MLKPIRVGVVGVGRLGSIHAKTYSQLSEVQLVGVCDALPKRAEEVAQLYPGCRAYQNISDLIPFVDSLTIATPTETHYEVAKTALQAGKHLLVEKPITTTLEEADELISLAEAGHLILQVGHVERFNSAIAVVLNQQKFPRFIECHRLGPFSPRVANIGVVLDLMIHDIDIVLGLVKSPIQHLDAVGVKILTHHEDIANVRIRFQNGAVANLTASRVTQETLRKIRIFQEETYLSLDYVKQELMIYRKTGGQIHSESYPIQKEEPLRKEISSFIECIQNGSQPIVSGREARSALAVALEIVQQIHTVKSL